MVLANSEKDAHSQLKDWLEEGDIEEGYTLFETSIAPLHFCVNEL